ncbi:hypothetical protein KVR01_007276 [Diaporthe batatas]|uniref:uncharacterized protein n=1 Tax=Diaporthe batatas TaxID=748121 RepID=UPI001D049E6D|nr:uncharacterized protein KVR01_007276 [Diaporthe batatas]KAG8162798.1 hypothetical protein KVR01_007276 [Diaporthe batatas]
MVLIKPPLKALVSAGVLRETLSETDLGETYSESDLVGMFSETELAELDPANATLIAAMLKDEKPDCERLGHRVDEDPRWDFETAHLAKCECWKSLALKKCRVTIPNDHIFNERNRQHKPQWCGKSVYDETPRWSSAKSGRTCISDHMNVARIQWNNGIGTPTSKIKQGFDKGTCYQFKDVPCVGVKKPSTD